VTGIKLYDWNRMQEEEAEARPMLCTGEAAWQPKAALPLTTSWL